MTDLLDHLSTIATLVIVSACAVHLCAFLVLWGWARRDLKRIAGTLFEFTRGLRHQSLFDSTGHLSDQIDAFLEDVKDVLDDPARQGERKTLLDRMRILDERRRYLQSMSFQTCYNICRTMIEAYPLAGVLGTILAIGAALQAESGGGAATVGTIVNRFGDAIWSTFAGLMSAILLMFLNSLVEPSFARLAENRRDVRETAARAKRELAIGRTGEDSASSPAVVSESAADEPRSVQEANA